jgi:hypothetical protein
MLHWFIVPITICGILIGIDAVDWLRGRLDLMDPVGIVGLIGFHFFFLAPLLHVYFDSWMLYVTPPSEWRDWLGYMGILNVVGLFIYRHVRERFKKYFNKSFKTIWITNESSFWIIITAGLITTGLLQLWVYQQYGGFLGYIFAYDARMGAFEGMGWIFMISESFPILALIAYCVYVKNKKRGKSLIIIIIILVIYLCLQLFFGGFRGSRSNTIWGLFWGIGIIHLFLRPLPRYFVYIGIMFLFIFMYVYGFYKGAGYEITKLLEADYDLQYFETRTGRTMDRILLGDLGRSDVQAFLLYRQTRPDSDYQLAYGRTYLSAILIAIPRNLWPDRPVAKVREGTDLLYGRDTFDSGVRRSSRIYGLAGEAILNFGPIAIPFSFILLALSVNYVNRLKNTLHMKDARLLIVPLLINVTFILLVADSDNVIFFLLKNGLLPFILIYFSSMKHIRLSD